MGYPVYGGPLNGTVYEGTEEELRVTVPLDPEDDEQALALLLEASILIQERGMAAIPTKTAVYRKRPLRDGNVVRIERFAYIHEEWE
jgi:hypothetical protein